MKLRVGDVIELENKELYFYIGSGVKSCGDAVVIIDKDNIKIDGRGKKVITLYKNTSGIRYTFEALNRDILEKIWEGEYII